MAVFIFFQWYLFLMLTWRIYQGPCLAPTYFKIFTSVEIVIWKGGFAHETLRSLNLHFTSAISALLLAICCFSSWTNLTRDYSPHTRPTWWRWPPPSCWPAWPRWASSSWCSPMSSRGSAPCIINVKRTRQHPDQIGYKGTLTLGVNVTRPNGLDRSASWYLILIQRS